MAERITNPWTDGEALYSQDLNDTFGYIENKITKIIDFDSTTSYDFSISPPYDSSKTATKNKTILVSPTDYDYFVVEIIGQFNAYAYLSYANAYIDVKINVDDVEKKSFRIVHVYPHDGAEYDNVTYFKYIYGLSESEKANGFKIDIIWDAYTYRSSSGDATASFTNSSITTYLMK